ncbi:adenylate kinase-domain-containing protein [Fimicolochytrium jonesii]|uniref:adenylate kinase-domain-containing protein n=1 Tax=Fimicolochytrium jonesii TaxID=1396493 RepID=UPI0022FEFC9C|nr:adenylate kinase-domain-containing protein [Fimicolochytrium jonesii]KAI8821851.1 adenylate kinase-domain-containing protein [Fimicolochytrium jonesii]
MIVTAQPGVDLQTEARTYFERKRIGQILECLVTGLTFSRPEDPLAYIEECVHRLRVGDLPDGKSQLKWDVFIPPPLQSSTAIAASLPRPTSVKKPKNAVPPLRKRPAALPPMRQQGIDLPVVGGEKPLSKRSAGLRKGDAQNGLADAANHGNQTGGGGSLLSKPLPPIAHEQPVTATTKAQLSPAWDNIVFVLGGPGCGKGTQCVRIAKDYNYCHLSAGDLLRDEVATGSELGQELNQMMKEGKIVPMHVTIRLLKEAMERAPPTFSGFLIDGFPRQLDQAVAFEEQIRPCKFVLYFECSEAVMEKRLLKRGETSGRADDNMETIKKRFKTFLDTSLPVIRAFAEKGKCVQISSEPAPEEVYKVVRKSFDAPAPLNHPNIVFVLGGPGSGKGTQCVRLAKEFNLAHLSTGDLLRAEIDTGSAIGHEVEGIMKEGKMVPMRIIMGLLRSAMEQNMNTPGFLIDGFPRAMSQVVEFEKSIGPCKTVLYFTCSLQTLEQRLIERGKTSGRVDDNLETIRKRFRTFMNESVEVVEWYKQKGTVIEISSEAPIEDVYQTARKVFVQEKRLDHPNVNFILGGPGSGKGTQCVRLAKDFNLKHISTGDLLRAEVEQGTEVGRIAQDIMVQGKMVPMDLIMGLLVKEIKNNFGAKGFLIDGFPRSLDQTLAFERVVGIPRQVLYFKCPLDVLEQRLLERGKTSGRADDTLDTIKQRFVTYENESLPVVEHYRKAGKLVEISSVPPVEEVYKNAQQYFQDASSAPSEHARPFDGRNLVFVLGGPGSGKGTQCAKLVDELHWAHLSTGDLLREEVARGSELGKKLEADMKEGKMVSMDVTLQLLLQAMKEKSDAKGFLIDGFPRTMEQAKVFEDTIGRCTFVLYFSANHEVLTERLLERGKTSGRADDNAESIAKRLKTFDEMSLPVIQHFARDERVKEVVSEGSIDEITSRTLHCFEGLD